MFGCIADAGCTALARVPANRHDHIKRVLDNGAHGVVVPMVNTRQEAEAAVAAMLYPPHGNRSLGGSVHALNFQASPADYYAKANNEILIVLQCEHPMAIDNAEQVYSVPGIDAVFIGPNDLAANMRTPDGKNPSAEEQAEAHRRLLAACKKIGVPAGIHCYPAEEAKKRIEEGWQFLAVGSELRMMMDSAGAIIRNIGLNAQGELARYESHYWRDTLLFAPEVKKTSLFLKASLLRSDPRDYVTGTNEGDISMITRACLLSIVTVLTVGTLPAGEPPASAIGMIRDLRMSLQARRVVQTEIRCYATTN
jgi:4-hydroxy-2-oxoheptanedioate aldolase